MLRATFSIYYVTSKSIKPYRHPQTLHKRIYFLFFKLVNSIQQKEALMAYFKSFGLCKFV